MRTMKIYSKHVIKNEFMRKNRVLGHNWHPHSLVSNFLVFSE